MCAKRLCFFVHVGCLPAELFPCFCMETDKRHQKKDKKEGGGRVMVEDFAVVFPRTAHVRNLVFNLFFLPWLMVDRLT